MIREYENVREMLEASSKKFPECLAFKIKKGKEYEEITYSKLREDVEAIGKWLIDNDLKDKRIAVIGKNSYQWMLVYLAVLSINALIVPLDKGLLDYEIKEQLRRSKADAIFYADDFKEILADVDIRKICTDDEEFKEIIEKGKALELLDEYKEIKIDNKKMSLLLFTSGTTSKSKAVMLSQKNMMSDVYGLATWEKFYKTDVNIAILPFHHAFGMTQMLLFLSLGVCNVFCEGLRFAKGMNEYGVSVLVCVPRIMEEMYKTIQKTLEKKKKDKTVKFAIKLSSVLLKVGIDIRRKLFKEIIDGLGGRLRVIIVGAAAADPKILKWFNDIGILAIQGYGLTETAPCLTAENDKHMKKGSVGLALPNVIMKISEADDTGIGEIIVKGDMVMLGYYEDEENTNKVLKDGYFYTGDMGYIDDKGYIFITGRKKNVIVLSNGKNVFPEELEALLLESDAVKECIVSHKEENGKDSLFATIVYNTDYEKEEAKKIISEHIKNVNDKLILYKQIRAFEITDKEFQKTTTLKIKR